MSAEQRPAATPRSRVPRARSALWIAQWFAVVLVPAWLVVGTPVISGGDWSTAAILIFFVPLVPMALVLLLTAAILSVAIPSARRTRGGSWYVWLLAADWVCIGILPLLIPVGFDVITPSGFERLGVSESADQTLIGVFLCAAAVLLLLACMSLGLAGSARPFGDGSDRASRQRQTAPTRAAPGAD